MTMTARPSERTRPGRPGWGRSPRRGLVGVLLVIAAGLGCGRTTSLGRATLATDAATNGETGSTDADADRDTDDAATDRGVTPTGDARADMPFDTGPIIGNGRDAATDGPDAPDAADDADGP